MGVSIESISVEVGFEFEFKSDNIFSMDGG